MNHLSLHPLCAPGSVTAIEASIEPTATGCRALFLARGDIGHIVVPRKEQPKRCDDLWRTTCFEIFWCNGGHAYREFNLSPSGCWACYDFDGIREGMRDAPAEVQMHATVNDTELRLMAEISADMPLPATVALNAIVKDADGVNRYWALAFPPGAPEFHADTCRALRLEPAA